MVDVVKELEALRQNLLDLSLRNNLLNYRPSQRRTISISGRKPKEIYELFVLHEKSLRFRAKTRSKKGRKTKTEEGFGKRKQTFKNNRKNPCFRRRQIPERRQYPEFPF